MTPTKNPTHSMIAEITTSSSQGAAKWLKDLDKGDVYFWAAEKAFHAVIADQLGIQNYDKGIAIKDDE